jgi:hypothetical protein
VLREQDGALATMAFEHKAGRIVVMLYNPQSG